MNSTPKHALQSKTIIGLLVTIIALVLNLFDVDFGAEEQANLLYSITQIFGIAVAVYGRFDAKQPITLKTQPSPLRVALPASLGLLLMSSAGCAGLTSSQRYAVTSNAFSATVTAGC